MHMGEFTDMTDSNAFFICICAKMRNKLEIR